MSPHPTPSPLEFNPVLSRRVLLGGAGALAATGALSACGSSSSKVEHKASETPLYEINEQDRSKLKQGGTLNLSTYSLGPDFNRFSQNGSSMSVSDTMGVIPVPASGGAPTRVKTSSTPTTASTSTSRKSTARLPQRSA